ncbi:MAG: adenylate kinase [Acidobacteria bacterium]|nr:MAG: adenylate kinase [Acidobacteriota bacterium]
MSKIIVLMGAPGAGKGTQARLLQERLHLPQISTGDILRARAQQNDELAKEIQEVQAAGKLASDDLVGRVVRERTSQPDCQNGYVLDGFPRTIAQAEMLEDLAATQDERVRAIFIDVPFGILEKRIAGRLSCPICGEIYNIYFKPPKLKNSCDRHPDARLIQRVDDTPEKVQVRLETYNRETEPLLDYYQRTGRLHRVDGTRSPDEIYRDVERIVNAS